MPTPHAFKSETVHCLLPGSTYGMATCTTCPHSMPHTDEIYIGSGVNALEQGMVALLVPTPYPDAYS